MKSDGRRCPCRSSCTARHIKLTTATDPMEPKTENETTARSVLVRTLREKERTPAMREHDVQRAPMFAWRPKTLLLVSACPSYQSVTWESIKNKTKGELWNHATLLYKIKEG